mgnify:FL=1
MKPIKPAPAQRIPANDLADGPAAAWVSIFRDLGFPAYPVRVEDETVCIMAPAEDCERLLEEDIREQLIAHGKALGYRFITLDIGHFVD